MKALLDMPVSAALLDVLTAYGHEGVHATELGLERATDRALLSTALSQQRVVITADLDFPQLLALSEADGLGVILFRGGNYSDHEMCRLLERVLQTVTESVLEHSICVVDKKRIRVAPLPLERRDR